MKQTSQEENNYSSFSYKENSSQSYSYKPARYGSGKMGMIKHSGLRTHNIKMYTKDMEIAKMHSDALKKAISLGLDMPKGKVESTLEPFDYTNPSHKSFAYLHENQSRFHRDRALHFLEMARKHTISDTLEISDNKPSTLPHMFETDNHTVEEGLNYHSTLHGDALLEAQSYKDMAETMKSNASEKPNPNYFENLEACSEAYSSYMKLAEMHLDYVNNYKEYLNNQASDIFNKDMTSVNKTNNTDMVVEPSYGSLVTGIPMS